LEVSRPVAALLEPLAHDTHGKGADQAGGFRHADEGIGLEQAALRRVPAGENFETRELAGLQTDLRLEVGNELARLDAGANIILELRPGEKLLLHLLVEPDRAIPSGALGRIHGDVGAPEAVFGTAVGADP